MPQKTITKKDVAAWFEEKRELMKRNKTEFAEFLGMSIQDYNYILESETTTKLFKALAILGEIFDTNELFRRGGSKK